MSQLSNKYVDKNYSNLMGHFHGDTSFLYTSLANDFRVDMRGLYTKK
jgi:hypothetical protein